MKQVKKQTIAISLLLAAGLMFLNGCGKTKTVSGTVEDSPYPCSWTANGRRGCRIEVGEVPEAAEWTIIQSGSTVEIEQQDNASCFTVKGVRQGSGSFTLQLRESDKPVEIGADLNFYVSVNEKKVITVESAQCRNVGAEEYATSSGARVYSRTGDNGSVFLHLMGTDWTALCSDGVSMMGPTPDGDSVRLELIATGNAGERSVLLQSSDAEQGIRVILAYEGGSLRVTGAEEVELLTREELLEAIRNELDSRPQTADAADSTEDTAADAESDEGMSTLEYKKQQAKLQAAIAAWTEENGREPNKYEIAKIRESIAGEK